MNKYYVPWTDVVENFHASACLPPSTQSNLDRIREKIGYMPQRFARPGQNYKKQSGILTLGLSYERDAQKYAECSYPSYDCEKWQLCHYCRHNHRKELLKTFLTAFREGQFYFISTSFVRSCEIAEVVDLDMVPFWDACRHGIRSMVTKRKKGGCQLLDGAYYLEEVHIESLFPRVRVLPHSHALVFAPDMCKDHIVTLRRLTLNGLMEHWNEPSVESFLEGVFELADCKKTEEELGTMAISTATYPILTKDDMAAVLNYLIKTIDLVTPYESATEGRKHDLELLEGVNLNTELFLDSWYWARMGRRQRQPYGQLHFASSQPLGVDRVTRGGLGHRARMDRELNEMKDSIWTGEIRPLPPPMEKAWGLPMGGGLGASSSPSQKLIVPSDFHTDLNQLNS